MKLKANLHKLVFSVMIFAPCLGAYSNATADDVEEVTVTGTATSDAWSRYYLDLLISLEQQRDDALAGYIQAQQEWNRQQHEAEYQLSACLGRSRHHYTSCMEVVEQVNVDDVKECGNLPGAGAAASVELSFGVVAISAELDGEAKVRHCKDVVVAKYNARKAGCKRDEAERNLACYGG